MGSKTLVIPDIHHRYPTAEEIISRERPDLTIFLGDYFDDFGDGPEMAGRTAKWLARSLECDGEEGGRIHLLGNHDLHYMTGNADYRCSGYSDAKRRVIDSYGIDWAKLRLYYWIGAAGTGWLCTHAGFSNRLYAQQRRTESEPVQDVLCRAVEDLAGASDKSVPHPFLEAGRSRGGPNSVGGLIWCDYGEFVDIPHTRQIFGHTRDSKVRRKVSPDSAHYCIDTVLCNYAICEDQDVVRIKTN
ncbi:MAG: metallophosphoesterase [Nitrosopumilaceae archaeon]|nr:metallophosphoesterase [Nitrosopumilaceae archaeon]